MKFKVSKEELKQYVDEGSNSHICLAHLPDTLTLEGEPEATTGESACRLCKHGDEVGDCAHDCHTPKPEFSGYESFGKPSALKFDTSKTECCLKCKNWDTPTANQTAAPCLDANCPCHKREESCECSKADEVRGLCTHSQHPSGAMYCLRNDGCSYRPSPKQKIEPINLDEDSSWMSQKNIAKKVNELIAAYNKEI